MDERKIGWSTCSSDKQMNYARSEKAFEEIIRGSSFSSQKGVSPSTKFVESLVGSVMGFFINDVAIYEIV